MSITKRKPLTKVQKDVIIKSQLSNDGSLRCFISGRVISVDTDDIEFDHITPISKGGADEVDNIKVVLKEFNRRKSDQTLYQARENYELEKLFNEKRKVRLQDIFDYKRLEKKSFHYSILEDSIQISDGEISMKLPLFFDDILGVKYFYGSIPLTWIENDDEEGLQPRSIIYKKLLKMRDHLSSKPQLAPSIARLKDGKILQFDGQHKNSGCILNEKEKIDIKVFISPDDESLSKKLFDELMRTNLEAHSELAQESFFTSTLFDRLSVIYKEHMEEYLSTPQPVHHSESDFVNFLVTKKNEDRKSAREMIKSTIINTAIKSSDFKDLTSEASKDLKYPLSVDVFKKFILPNLLYLEPSISPLQSDKDYRDEEIENFKMIAKIMIEKGRLNDWVSTNKNEITDYQRKVKRFWYRGSVITWSQYLKSIILNSLNIITNDERARLLYRPKIQDYELKSIEICLDRLFNHPMWDEPMGSDIDTYLTNSQRQTEFFIKKGLTEIYVLTGKNI
jgi:5-methylcytosine-specific restriction endonuclease McrA